MRALEPSHHRVTIGTEPTDLPIMAINDELAIALLVMVDMGVKFGERVGKGLAAVLAPHTPDIVVSAATLGIPVAIEVTRALGLDHYVIAQKAPKFYLRDALTQSVHSIVSHDAQKLMLDRRSLPLVQGKRVAIVDDVVATASSMAALCALVRQAGGNIVKIGVVLTEARRWQTTLGADAALVTGFGHIPQFRIAGGRAILIPETL